MWKEEYVRIGFPNKAADLNIAKTQKLKFDNMPSSFYRYRNFTSNNIDNLKENIEWQSYPSEFNDPFDAMLKVSIDTFSSTLFRKDIDLYIDNAEKHGIHFTEEEIEELLSSVHPHITLAKKLLNYDPQLKNKDDEIQKYAELLNKKILENYDKVMDNFRKGFNMGYLVTCFSEVKDSVLMWSHYSENHTGYCIEYDFKSLGPDNSRVRLIEPVIYNDELFDATEYYIETFSNQKGFNNLYGIYPTISKSSQWEYEKEWRLIFPYGPGVQIDDRKKRALYMPVPKALYLGSKINEDNKNIILKIAKEKKITVYQMIQDKNGYNLSEELVYQG
ncbi:DUF2971 domain-containing protein [Lysinibacillus xylanilyticus]|uniref:DUF2971 domain-containing protein n=1 Tax=Lysinibacillus xylanilyticus TaxID=582475 RepID=UPI003819F3EA